MREQQQMKSQQNNTATVHICSCPSAVAMRLHHYRQYVTNTFTYFPSLQTICHKHLHLFSIITDNMSQTPSPIFHHYRQYVTNTFTCFPSLQTICHKNLHLFCLHLTTDKMSQKPSPVSILQHWQAVATQTFFYATTVKQAFIIILLLLCSQLYLWVSPVLVRFLRMYFLFCFNPTIESHIPPSWMVHTGCGFFCCQYSRV